MQELEKTKFKERLDFAVELMEKKAKEKGLPFTESLLVEASAIAIALFVRSEIQYSSKSRDQ